MPNTLEIEKSSFTSPSNPTHYDENAIPSDDVELEVSDAELADGINTGKYDAYTVSESGNFIGSDGFVVPKDFAEFNERFPDYILTWVKQHVRLYQIPGQTHEDCASELTIHLLVIPEDSVYRTPGYNGLAEGCTDRIQTFNPEKIYGVTANRFFWFIHRILLNRFIVLLKRSKRNPLDDCSTAFFVQLRGSRGVNSDRVEFFIPTEDLIQQSATATFKGYWHGVQSHTNAYVAEFVSFIREHNVELLPVLEALVSCPSFIAARESLGLDERTFTRQRSRIKTLLDCFSQDQPVPKQRKLYRSRKSSVEPMTADR
jgi:hypothetical protein